MKKVKKCVITSIVVLISSLGLVSVVEATGGNGGAVQTNGAVGFYDESTDSSSSESSSDSSTESSTSSTSSTTEPLPDSSEQPIKKPGGGKYPSTGELVKASFTTVGVVLVGAALFFLFWRSKNKGKEENS